MNVELTQIHGLPPEQLGKALAEATPEEFGEFWFAFAQAMEQADDKPMMAFAQAMIDRRGGKRQKPLHNLVKLMDFCEVAEQQAAKAREAQEDGADE